MNLLKKMLKEEWRMHSFIFGSYRFALFPVAILLLALTIFYSFPFFGFDLTEVQLGMHWIVFFLGLNVGTLGFVSRGGMRNVLGKMNLLLFSSRTLPLSKRGILGNFLLKDFIYYFFYLLIPLVLGNLVLTVSPASLLWITLSYSLAFILGLGTTFFLTVIYRVLNKILVGIFGLSVLIALYFMGFGLSSLPPCQLYLNPSAFPLFMTLGLMAIFFIGGTLLFQRGGNKEIKGRRDLFIKLSEKLEPLNAKNIVDLQRSSGGLAKIFFSFAVLFLFMWFLLAKFPFGKILFNRPLLVLAVLFGVFPVSIYNWLNRYDSEGDYLHLPLKKDGIIRGKIRSYLLLGPISVVVADLLTCAVFGGTLIELAHAFLISIITSLAVLAILVKTTGLDPNMKLFDVTVFGKFLGLSAAVMIPFLITSLFYPPGSFQANLLLLLLYLIIGLPACAVLRTTLRNS